MYERISILNLNMSALCQKEGTSQHTAPLVHLRVVQRSNPFENAELTMSVFFLLFISTGMACGMHISSLEYLQQTSKGARAWHV
jgi:hypothetical protein